MSQSETAAVVDYATPGLGDDSPSWFARLVTSALRQTAHRSLSLALILLLCGIGAWAANKTPTALLLWAFAAADVALLAAVLLLAGGRRRSAAGSEALSTAGVAAGVVFVALTLYLLARAYRGP